MGDLSERASASGRAGWSLLHCLRRVFAGPAAPCVGLPVASIPVATDEWPAGMRILVADDNPLNLMVASEMLAHFGIKSLLAADGTEAVAMAANTHLDLILMDLQMPVLDGLAATRQIRRFEREQNRARIPVVAYTSFSGNKLQLSDYGFDDVLEKPCELRAMRACLLRWCARQGRNDERDEVVALLRH